MSVSFPPSVRSVVDQMVERATKSKEVSSLRVLDQLKKGNPAPLLERFEQLKAKKSMTAGELKEMKELDDAIKEINAAKTAATKPGHSAESGFDTKKAATGPNLSGGGVNAAIDRVQDMVDKANMALTAGSLASMATGVGLAPGAVANVAGKVADALNAVVDLGQAGVALATGDTAGAAKQALSAGAHAIGVIPGLGDAKKVAALAKATSAVAKEGAKDVAKEGAKDLAKEGAKDVAKEGAKDAAKAGAQEGAKDAAKAGAQEGAKDAAKETGKAGTAASGQAASAGATSTVKMSFDQARKAEIKFPDPVVGGTSHFRTFSASGKTTTATVEGLLSNNANIGATAAPMFEKAIEKKLLANPAFAKDKNAFNAAVEEANKHLRALDNLRPKNGVMTKATVEEAVKSYDRALAHLKGANLESGTVQAEMLSALTNARQALANVAANWKPGLNTAQLSSPRGSLFSWLS